MFGVAVEISLTPKAGPLAEDGEGYHLATGQGGLGPWPLFRGERRLEEIIHHNVKCCEEGVGFDHQLAPFHCREIRANYRSLTPDQLSALCHFLRFTTKRLIANRSRSRAYNQLAGPPASAFTPGVYTRCQAPSISRRNRDSSSSDKISKRSNISQILVIDIDTGST